MGNKLFKNFLKADDKEYEVLSFVDILDKLEKLKIIDSAEEWIGLRKLRNKLTHEYPDEINEIQTNIEYSVDKIDIFERTLAARYRVLYRKKENC